MLRSRRPEQTQELLTRYARTGTSACFEEIVRRYGAMVLAVCQGVTRNRHDAEDATQVTFFVLAERLRAGETVHSLGSWLGQVARRAALDIRRSGTRRQRREENRAVPEVAPDSVAERFNSDQVAALVREELDRVPAKYRIPLVLHYFGGLEFNEAARELGLKPATLGVRLFRGRKLLGERLVRRGVSLSSPALATCLTHVIRRSLSHALQQSAARAACVSGMRPLAASPPALGLVSTLVGSKVKLLTAAALIVAATAGARAAAHHLPDLPGLLDLGRLRLRAPSIRSSLPHLRVDAGNAAAQFRRANGNQFPAEQGPAPVSVDISQSTMTHAQPTTPAAPSAKWAGAGGGVVSYASSARARLQLPFAAETGTRAASLQASGIAGSTSRATGISNEVLPAASGSHAQPNAAAALASGIGPAKGVGSTPMANAKPTWNAGAAAVALMASSGMMDTQNPRPFAGPTPPGGATALQTTGKPGASTYGAGQNAAGITQIIGITGGTSPTLTGVPSANPAGTKPIASPWSGLLQITSSGLNSSQLSFLNPDDPSVPAPPGGNAFLGVWAVAPGQLDGTPVTFSYDSQLLTSLGRDPSQVTLWAYDGKWTLVSSPGSADATLNDTPSIQFFAVGLPEPTGAAIGVVAGIGLLMRRRPRRR